MKKEKDIDNIFKKGFDQPDDNYGYMDDDWAAMEQMLDKRNKKPLIIYWLPLISSVAALLLLFFGWWLLKPSASHNRQNRQVAAVKITSSKAGSRILPNNGHDKITPADNKIQNASRIATINATGKQDSPVKNSNHRTVLPLVATHGSNDNAKFLPKGLMPGGNQQLVAYSAGAIINGTAPGANETIPAQNVLPQQQRQSKGSLYINGSKKSSVFAYRPQFALSVLASTDKNGVNSFQQSKGGDNAGLLFSLGLSKKLTISTGAIYTSKQYMTDFANYHSSYQFQTDPSTVLADCRMFDIPLNIDYQIYHKHNNKLSVGTGVSSYLMLHENYQFNFADNNITTASYNVANPDKYLLSIINFQATYERQINSKFGLTVQPYLKLPLSAVGYSQVHLQTTGGAIGVTWNLNSLSKP